MGSVGIEAVRGTKDVLMQDSYKWRYVESVAQKVAADFGFKEVRFPTFEKTELFVRGVGDTTDVVQKEMYTFVTKGEDSITLRPEGTASVARLCLQNGLFAGLMPLKMYYIISCFRYEKPQAGRYREFHQFGVELYGTQAPSSDAEVIALADTLIKRLGIKGVKLKINSIGCPTCRKDYHTALKSYFEASKDELCDTCKDRLDRNPMRILDCKSPVCQGIAKDAPKVTEYLCEECAEHFEKFKAALDNLGIEYEVDTSIVRGLDYYTKSVFEFVDEKSGLTVLAGGRYDGLIEDLAPNQKVCGLGFATGIERLLLVMEQQGCSFGREDKTKIYIANIGEKGAVKAQALAFELRKEGISAETDISSRSLKAQMKYADKTGAEFTMVLGDDEVESGKAVLRRMSDGEKTEVEFSDLAKVLKD